MAPELFEEKEYVSFLIFILFLFISFFFFDLVFQLNQTSMLLGVHCII
jgi:hypothetical protein